MVEILLHVKNSRRLLEMSEKKNIVIVGAGSVGSAIFAYLNENNSQYNISLHDPPKGQFSMIGEADIIHITVPMINYNDYIINVIREIENQIINNPMIIIHSTIDPYILNQCSWKFADWFYNPIRCPEEKMNYMVCRHLWLFAPIINSHSQRYIDYLYTIGITFKEFKDPKALAFGKLLETTRTGMEIAFAQMVAAECERNGWDFNEAYNEYTHYTNDKEDYRQLNKSRMVPRPIFFPGKIGGKCIMQNLEIIKKDGLLPTYFTEWISQSNEVTKKCPNQ